LCAITHTSSHRRHRDYSAFCERDTLGNSSPCAFNNQNTVGFFGAALMSVGKAQHYGCGAKRSTYQLVLIIGLSKRDWEHRAAISKWGSSCGRPLQPSLWLTKQPGPGRRTALRVGRSNRSEGRLSGNCHGHLDRGGKTCSSERLPASHLKKMYVFSFAD